MRAYLIPLFCLLFQFAGAHAAPVEEEIRDITESILIGEDLQTLPAIVVAKPVIPLFYESRGYAPTWQDREVTRRVLAIIASSYEEGLDPADYHYPELMALVEDWDQQILKSNRTLAQFDILLTDGLMLYARHLIEGKVDPGPLEYSWNYSQRNFAAEEVVKRVTAAIDKGRIADALDALKPGARFYGQLKAALAFYRRLADSGRSVRLPG